METVTMTDITKMRYVVGYQLPIRPSKYEIEVTTAGNTVSIVNIFTVSKNDACCIPLCCLFPACQKRKTVTDRFILNGDNLILQSTSAFGGLISCIEKGKVFQIVEVGRYIVLVNKKEIFIYSDNSKEVSKRDRFEMIQKIEQCEEAPKKIDIVFLD